MQDPIENFLADVEMSDKKESTHEKRYYDLKRFDAFLDREGIDVLGADTRHLHQWLREESDEFAPNTVRGRYDSLVRLYAFLSGIQGRIDHDPTEDLMDRSDYGADRRQKHDTEDLSYVTPEEVDQLADNAPAPKLRNDLLIRLGFQTGMRRSELVRVELENIDRDRHSIRIYAPKTDNWRTVFYQESLDFLLDQWINVYREGYEPAARSPYLFVSHKNERLQPNRVSRIVRDAAKEAGIQREIHRDANGTPRYRITAHTLRHGHAVHALKSGIDIRSVADQMGHSNIETTMDYLHFVESDVEEAYANWTSSDE